MARKRTPRPPYGTFVDVFGYNLSVFIADRGAGGALISVRLLKRVNDASVDVGRMEFYDDEKALPNDEVRNPGTANEAILMNAHLRDYEYVLDALRNERHIRIYFSGSSPTQGLADLRSLRENF